MTDTLNLLPLDPISRPSVADRVFEKLHTEIVSLSLPPGARVSEGEVAKALGTSRQPVRDAFFRLSKLGFLEIRPQRATTISLISTEKVMEARFVRTALEVEIIRQACLEIDDRGYALLRANLDQQAAAVKADDRKSLHRLDDGFHELICAISGHPFAWQTISESKSHLDRARLLSLSFNMELVLGEHVGLFDALVARDTDMAVLLMRSHLSRLSEQIGRIQSEHPDYFAESHGDQDL